MAETDLPGAEESLAPPPEFAEIARAQGIAFEPGELERITAFLERLRDANRRFNLTRILDAPSMWERHVLDSLTLLPILSELAAASVADVGSGGGLPGIPLAICMPETRFVLFEATGKKARFLAETAEALELANVEVVADRVETAGSYGAPWRDVFDAVVARAVGPLAVLAELTVPLARVGGVVIAVKGAKAEEEIAAAREALYILHATVMERLRTPTGTLVLLEKRRTTPRNYPRRPGEPARAPLGPRA